jgi:hypothetical protein
MVLLVRKEPLVPTEKEDGGYYRGSGYFGKDICLFPLPKGQIIKPIV